MSSHHMCSLQQTLPSQLHIKMAQSTQCLRGIYSPSEDSSARRRAHHKVSLDFLNRFRQVSQRARKKSEVDNAPVHRNTQFSWILFAK